MDVFVLLAMIVLLPIIPAYILFKLLESKGEVTSVDGSHASLLGFKVQLGGAFAGYFSVLLVLLFAFQSQFIHRTVNAVWTLEGRFVDEKLQPVPVGVQNVTLTNPKTVPFVVTSAGGFVIGFVEEPDQPQPLDSPSINVSYGDYLTKLINLQDPEMKGYRIDADTHKIFLPPIKLIRADATPGQIFHSAAIPLTESAPEYDKYEQTGSSAPPPGYASNSVAGPQR